jgi:hypothetical protein
VNERFHIFIYNALQRYGYLLESDVSIVCKFAPLIIFKVLFAHCYAAVLLVCHIQFAENGGFLRYIIP